MKAVGIIRNIDRLGRLVIPAEMRRHMNIRVGDPIEFFTDNEGGIILRKYSLEEVLVETVDDLQNLASSYDGDLPFSVISEVRKHVAELKKLLDQK